MDTFSGYNQIRMTSENEKIAFVTKKFVLSQGNAI